MSIEHVRTINPQQSKFQKLIRKVKAQWFQPLFYEPKTYPVKNNEPKQTQPNLSQIPQPEQIDTKHLFDIVESFVSSLETGKSNDVNTIPYTIQSKIHHNYAKCSYFFGLLDDEKQKYIKQSLWLWNTSHIEITTTEQRYAIPIIYVQNSADLTNKFGKNQFFYHQARHSIIVIDQGDETLNRFYSTYPLAKSILSVLPAPKSSSDDMYIRMMLPYLVVSDVFPTKNPSDTIVQVIQKNSSNNKELISKAWDALMWLYQDLEKYEPDAFRRMIMLAMTPYVYHSQLIWHLADSNPHAYQP